MNPYYTATFNVTPGNKVISQVLEDQFALVQIGFDGVESAVTGVASLASPNFTGIPTAPTATAGTNTTQLATTEFVNAAAFSSSLPAQAGNNGKVISTDGSNANWSYIKTINGSTILASGDLTFPTFGTQTFTGAQRCTVSALTDGATVTPDFSLSNQYNLTLGGNRTLALPTNVVQGQQGLINVWQDPTGSRTLAYAWVYSWAGGTAGTLSTAGCTRDMLAYSVDYYSSGTFTVTIATPGVFTKVAHGFISGQKCQLSTTGALPTGLAAATTYYIRAIDADTFRLCTSLANVAASAYIATTGTQSGTHTITCASIALSLSKAVA